jgi:hypothetical protein
LSGFSFANTCSFVINKSLYFGAVELSPPPEPYNPKVDPALKGALDVIRMANEPVDKAMNRLLKDAADKILKEDN